VGPLVPTTPTKGRRCLTKGGGVVWSGPNVPAFQTLTKARGHPGNGSESSIWGKVDDSRADPVFIDNRAGLEVHNLGACCSQARVFFLPTSSGRQCRRHPLAASCP
jgi:hypothetical protein